MEHNILGWFEIPVTDMDRAIRFYESVFRFKMELQNLGILKMAWFPWKSDGIGAPGSLVLHEEFYVPSGKDGVLIYLTTPTGDLNLDQKEIEMAGGEILIPRRQISEEHGYMMVFLDTEGNRIALHSRT